MAALLLLLALTQSPEAAEKIRRAGEMMQSGRASEAIPLYRELAAEYPGVPSFGINLAVAQYKAGLYQDAIAQCQALIDRCLAKNPADRFASASALREALLTIAAGGVAPAEATRSFAPRKKGKAALVAACAGALMLTGAAAWLFFH